MSDESSKSILLEEEKASQHREDTNPLGTFRHWLCTWNNPPADYWAQILRLKKLTYVEGQMERGDKNGVLHFQFVLIFKDKVGMRSIKKCLGKIFCTGKPAFLAESCLRYCTKKETRVEDPISWGKKPCPRPTKAVGIDRFQATLEACKAGQWDKSEASHQVRYFQNLTKLEAYYTEAKSSESLRGIWIHGSSGSGKSCVARKHWGRDFYVKPQNKWWDNYRGEKTIILDDFDHQGSCLGHYIKIWADHYAVKGEIKGGSVALKHDRFVITSQYLPEDIWPNDSELVTAIRRRFHFGTASGKFPEFVIDWDDQKISETLCYISSIKE